MDALPRHFNELKSVTGNVAVQCERWVESVVYEYNQSGSFRFEYLHAC